MTNSTAAINSWSPGAEGLISIKGEGIHWPGVIICFISGHLPLPSLVGETSKSVNFSQIL